MKLNPFGGMDNRSRDNEMVRGGDTPVVFVREAVNGDFTDQGRFVMRCGVRKVGGEALTDLWQSPLDGTVLARREGWLVAVSMADWSVLPLFEVGADELFFLPLNDAVLISCARGIIRYANGQATLLTIPAPAAPWLSTTQGGLTPGQYGVALAWMSGSREGPLSEMAFVHLPERGAIQVTLPPRMHAGVSGYRLYMTQPDGGVLYHVEDGSADSTLIGNDLTPGKQPPFQHMREMAPGRYLTAFGGRIAVARGNGVLFSQPLAYHIHDARSDFVSMPQPVTFLAPVDGGLWVGQRDHAVFLAGTSPKDLRLVGRNAGVPVPGSAVLLSAGDLAGEIGAGGVPVAAWMSDKGYVLGMPDGSMAAVSADVLTGIHGNWGRTVAHGRRLLTIAR